MLRISITDNTMKHRQQAGVSLIELVVTLAILVTVSAVVILITSRMARTQLTLSTRTDMHSSVRSATEMMQQEISQAGRVSTPLGTSSPATLTQDISVAETATTPPPAKTVSNVFGLFPGEVVMVGPDTVYGGSPCPQPVAAAPSCGSREPITISAVTITNNSTGAGTITPFKFWNDPHSGTSATQKAPIGIQGAFAAGIIPPTGSSVMYWDTTTFNLPEVQVLSAAVVAPATVKTPGSSGTVLKMFGDINGDGNMVYIEYKCTLGTQAAPGTLTRLSIPFTASAKNTFTPQVLLSNVIGWPVASPTPCFNYQTKVVRNNTYVIDVSVTLTVQTQRTTDAKGLTKDLETKALLNVSPRNVYEAWQMATLAGDTATRIQPIPQTVLNLLDP